MVQLYPDSCWSNQLEALWSIGNKASLPNRPFLALASVAASSSPTWSKQTVTMKFKHREGIIFYLNGWTFQISVHSAQRGFLESARMYWYTYFYVANWMLRCSDNCQQASWKEVALSHFEMFQSNSDHLSCTNSGYQA